ncbi:hypothetical protein B0T18DRAFT_422465 [Schizothecium vesticola]|uniref:Uncharacterized protein n=1 Tax=Schizothecium vesticola TaxID=314040 RepID=A0AA40BQX3_9PEZI|nr:hypothetical protein B0T18DRAFT_422465 [Schizothecium vesticola]
MTTVVRTNGEFYFPGAFPRNHPPKFKGSPPFTGARCQVPGKRKRRQFAGHQPPPPATVGEPRQHGNMVTGLGVLLQRPRTLKSGTEGALISPRATGRIVSGGFGGMEVVPTFHGRLLGPLLSLSSSPPYTA